MINSIKICTLLHFVIFLCLFSTKGLCKSHHTQVFIMKASNMDRGTTQFNMVYTCKATIMKLF